MRYEIINANTKEKNIIDTIMRYIESNFSNTYNYSKLKQIEVVNSLSGDSTARTIKDRILVAQKNGLELVQQQEITFDDISKIKEINMLFSSFYHELWHVNTWEKYSEMYEYVLDEKNDMYTSSAYVYWIEYIAHVETIYMENIDVMNTFCIHFVKQQWHKIEFGYSYFLKALPYYLVRAHFLNVFEDLTNMIRCKELRDATYEFDLLSKQLLDNCEMEEIEKAKEIKKRIIKLFE